MRTLRSRVRVAKPEIRQLPQGRTGHPSVAWSSTVTWRPRWVMAAATAIPSSQPPTTTNSRPSCVITGQDMEERDRGSARCHADPRPTTACHSVL